MLNFVVNCRSLSVTIAVGTKPWRRGSFLSNCTAAALSHWAIKISRTSLFANVLRLITERRPGHLKSVPSMYKRNGSALRGEPNGGKMVQSDAYLRNYFTTPNLGDAA